MYKMSQTLRMHNKKSQIKNEKQYEMWLLFRCK